MIHHNQPQVHTLKESSEPRSTATGSPPKRLHGACSERSLTGYCSSQMSDPFSNSKNRSARVVSRALASLSADWIVTFLSPRSIEPRYVLCRTHRRANYTCEKQPRHTEDAPTHRP